MENKKKYKLFILFLFLNTSMLVGQELIDPEQCEAVTLKNGKILLYCPEEKSDQPPRQAEISQGYQVYILESAYNAGYEDGYIAKQKYKKVKRKIVQFVEDLFE